MLLLVNDSKILSRQEHWHTESCQNSAHIQQYVLCRHLPHLQLSEDLAWGTQTTCHWEAFSVWFPKPPVYARMCCWSVLSQLLQNFRHSQMSQHCLYKEKSGGHETWAGWEARFFSAWGTLCFGAERWGYVTQHLIQPAADFCPVPLFLLDRWWSQRLWAQLPMASHKPPISFYSTAQHQCHVLRKHLSPKRQGRRSCDAVSSLPRAGEQLCGLLCACVSHCHLVTGTRTHEPATMGQ